MNCETPEFEPVWRLVMKNVASESIKDLKECRLVSQTWNRIATETLENYGYATVLDYSRLLEYKGLLWNARLSNSCAHSTLANTGHQPITSLRLALESTNTPCNLETFSPAGMACELLTQYPQLRVAFLMWTHDKGQDTNMVNQEVFYLLQLVSKQLTKITMVGAHFANMAFSQDFNFELYQQLDLPLLKVVELDLIRTKLEDYEEADFYMHARHILNRAKNLIKLKLDVTSKVRSAKTLKWLTEYCSTRLHKLDVQVWNGDIDWSELTFVNLTSLKVVNRDGLMVWKLEPDFFEFLSQRCPNLNKFYLGSLWMLEDDQKWSQPLAPNMKHFRIHGKFYNTFKHFQNAYQIYFQSLQKFENLSSLSIDLNVLVMIGGFVKEQPPPQILGLHPKLTIGGLCTLEVWLAVPMPEELYDLLKITSQVYSHIFRNVVSLAIVTNRNKFNIFTDRQVISAMELLCNLPKLETLEIMDYTRPFLEQVAIEKVQFEGVKRLKLSPWKRPWMSHWKSEDLPRLNFPELLKRFPMMEYLQLRNRQYSRREITML